MQTSGGVCSWLGPCGAKRGLPPPCTEAGDGPPSSRQVSPAGALGGRMKSGLVQGKAAGQGAGVCPAASQHRAADRSACEVCDERPPKPVTAPSLRGQSPFLLELHLHLLTHVFTTHRPHLLTGPGPPLGSPRRRAWATGSRVQTQAEPGARGARRFLERAPGFCGPHVPDSAASFPPDAPRRVEAWVME